MAATEYYAAIIDTQLSNAPNQGEDELVKREKRSGQEQRNTDSIEIFPAKMTDEMENFVEQRLLAKFHTKKKKKKEKELEQSLQRKLSMDMLAEEWFSDDKTSAEARVYIIEKLLPALVVGLEKVLLEAEKRNVINSPNDAEAESNRFGTVFNPVNMLAQQLMRNNPKFSNFPEASPYARGLRSVAEKIKWQVFDAKNNRLLELKEQAEMQRKKLEEEERKKIEEQNRRKKLMENQFQMWLLGDSTEIPLLLIQNGLFSYLEISSHLVTDPDNVIKFDEYLEPSEDTEAVMNKSEFVKFLTRYIKSFSSEQFTDVINHLDQCANAYRKTYEQDMWNSMFLKLFESLDSEGIGYLDRHRILHLFEKFWDQGHGKNNELNNPRKWPVIELEELEDIFSDSFADDEDMSVRLSNSSTDDQLKTSGSLEDTFTANERMEEPETDKPSDDKEDFTKPSADSEPDGDISKTADVQPETSEEPKDEESITEPKGESQTERLSGKQEEPAGEEAIVETTEVKPDEEPKPSGSDSPEPKVDEKDSDEATLEEKLDVDSEKVEDTNLDDKPEAEEEEKLEETTDKVDEKDATETQETTEESVPHDAEDAENDDEKKEKETPTAEESNEDKQDEKIQDDALKVPLSKGLVLTTPVLSDDGASSTAVKIQFSKSSPQVFPERQVRKTTSYSVVTSGKVAEKTRTNGDDTLLENGRPIQPITSNIEDQEDQSNGISSTTTKKSPPSLAQQYAADTDDASMSVNVKPRSATSYQMSVAFAVDPVSLTDKPVQEFYSEFSSRSHSRMSVFDESQLNKPRFVSLMEAFLGDEVNHMVVENLLNFIFHGYVETEEEKMERIAKAHREALSAKHKDMIENIFNKWDIDGRGYLEIDTIEDILSKYKGGSEIAALKRGRMAIRQSRKQRFSDSKISRKEFHLYINAVINAIAGGEEVFDSVIEFVAITVERTHAESIRGEARRKWLRQIQTAAETSGAIMTPVYRFIFQTLYKDAEAHGNQKKISAYIALLENNNMYPSRGNLLLRYAACTPDNAPFMLDKAFYEDMHGISFYCVRRGKVVHVPRVHSHGRIYFWNPQRLEEQKEASLVLLPVKDEDHRVFGLLGVDNLVDLGDRSVFATHELNFYQGIAKAFASAFHHVDLKQKLLCIIESAMSWIHSRAPAINNITIYFVEPDPKNTSRHVLRKMMLANNSTGVTQRYGKPYRLYRKDNLFRDYLFKCMETSDTVTAEAYGEYRMAYPIRGNQGDCQCVIDIGLGKGNELPKYQAQEMQRMLKLLQAANKEMLQESSSGKKNIVLAAEERISDDGRVEIMFDRLMLTDLRENVKKLDKSVFAELHNYKVPPTMIHNIVKAVLMLFYQEEEEYEELEDWVKCKQLTTAKLHQKIVDFDPTAKEAVSDEIVLKISNLLKGIAHGAVAKHGSIPAQQLYNWAFVCLSLIEHTRKAADSSSQPAVTPVTSASTATTTDTQESQKF